MSIETLDRRSWSEEDARDVAELLHKVWPRRSKDERLAQLLGEWRDYMGPESQSPRSLVVRESGRTIAHAEANPRTIGTPLGEMTVLALARVCTDPAERGRSLGIEIARAALRMVDEGVYPFALFQTSHHVRPFYERLGATVVENRIVNSLGDDPTKNPFWDDVVMRYPGGEGWPEGDIDLRGGGY